jgi:hypothetical protein
MKTGPDALGTAKIESDDEKLDLPHKMSPGMQNMKTRLGALGTPKNVSGGAKHENWTRRPLCRKT